MAPRLEMCVVTLLAVLSGLCTHLGSGAVTIERRSRDSQRAPSVSGRINRKPSQARTKSVSPPQGGTVKDNATWRKTPSALRQKSVKSEVKSPKKGTVKKMEGLTQKVARLKGQLKELKSFKRTLLPKSSAKVNYPAHLHVHYVQPNLVSK